MQNSILFEKCAGIAFVGFKMLFLMPKGDYLEREYGVLGTGGKLSGAKILAFTITVSLSRRTLEILDQIRCGRFEVECWKKCD